MQIINGYAKDTQAFVRDLQAAIEANDSEEASRLVNEHTTALEAFLDRMLAKLQHHPYGTLH